jgi:Ca2+-binding RTX toxin-like protein
MPKNKSIAMVALTLAVVFLALAVGSGSALAQSIMGVVIQCDDTPCIATGDSQILLEQVGDGVPDTLVAKGAHDILRADTYTNDSDVARGGGGNDVLHVNDGDINDLAIGGAGSNDVCVVDFGAEASDTCETVSVP